MNYPWVTEANRIFTGVLIGQVLIALIIAFFYRHLYAGNSGKFIVYFFAPHSYRIFS